MLSSQYLKKVLFNMHRFLNHCWYFYVTNTFTFCFFKKKRFNPWHSAGQWSTKNLKHVEKILFPHIKKKVNWNNVFFLFYYYHCFFNIVLIETWNWLFILICFFFMVTEVLKIVLASSWCSILRIIIWFYYLKKIENERI
jgi:hypothetical protein